MSNPYQIPFSFWESVTNLTLLILGIAVVCASFYFIGRNEENKRLALQKRQENRMKRLKNVLDRMNVEDLERE
jgi:hypothetical protein